MRPVRLPGMCCAIALLLNAGLATAASADRPVVEVSHLVGPLHALLCAGQAYTVASIGDDGTLLVDTGYPNTAEALRDALADLGGQPVRLIVNTHGDTDHVGGNALLGSQAVIVAHPWARQQMGRYFALAPVDTAGLPTLTVTDEAVIHFNGEEIHLIPVPGGHTGGDLVVYFTASRVAVIGDLVLAGWFPNTDPARSGDAQRLAQVLRHLVEVLPADTRIVAAHGKQITDALDLSIDDLRSYAEMIEASLALVRRELGFGRSLAEIQKRRVFGQWAALEGQRDLSMEGWTAAVFASITRASRPSICAPVTETLVADGVEAAIARYRQLRAAEPEAFDFGENQLNALGYQLLQRQMVDQAIAIFELNVEAFPDAFNPYDSLGEAYAAAGKTELAVASYQRSVELNPDNANGVAALARLRGE